MKLCMGCMNQIEDHLSTCPHCGFNEITLRQESYYLDPGTIVGGKYIIGRVLNYGGHTVSYLGMDAEKNRKVIVKEYLPSDFSTRSEGEKDVTIYSGDGQEQFEQGLTNFLNEANRIQHLQDAAGIAKVYDCAAENETGYVISEYVEGKTLKEILDAGKKYSAEEAAAFIRKILQGLSGIHHMNIVHCDISPETIMITKSGDIKLMDFGATRYVTTANSKSLSIILKRGYAPEEQYRSKGKRGPWTDVYAIGAVMYRMITGVVPQESVERALTDDLKEPSKLGIAISKNMENALMNALNVYQSDRTPSAEAFLEELNSDDVKRIKVKQKKNKTGKNPLWAKGMVACLACVVIVGGAYVVQKMAGEKADALKSEDITMKDFRGKSQEEIVTDIEELNRKYSRWDIQLDTENTVFDLDEKKNGTVCSQSIEPGTVLYNSDNEAKNEELNNLTYDGEGNISGTISVTLYSNEKLHYSEISGLNAYELAQKLGIDTSDKQYFAIEEKEGTDYFDLASLEVNGKTISASDLLKEENQDKEIAYSKDIKIHYYGAPFFYWEELPDFAALYLELDNLPEQPVYQYTNENKKKQVGRKSVKENDNLVDNSYYAIKSETYDVGRIAGQTVQAGEEYDESNPKKTLKIQVIGKVFDYKGKTYKEFHEIISNAGFGNYLIKDQDGTEYDDSETDYDYISAWPVTEVKTYKKDNADNWIDAPFFKKETKDDPNDQSIRFVITVQKQQPQPKTEPTARTSGSQNDNNSSNRDNNNRTFDE